MEYGGSLALDSPTSEDEVNVISALKQSHRVSSISLTVTTSLLEKLDAPERSFVELEDLVLLSRDSVPLTMPSTFPPVCCPRLLRLHLTRISFPPLLQLVRSSKNLVDLQLHEALNPSYISIEKLTDALSGMAQLRSLSLYFPYITNDVYPPPLSPYDQRVVLPALTHLKFRGIAEYLGCLVVRIDAPRLQNIQVTVVENFIFDLSRLGDFMDRIEMHKSLHQAYILTSKHAISISLTQPGAPTCFEFRLFSEQLRQSTLFRIIPHFSAFFLNVKDLRISTTRPSSQENSLRFSRYDWSELFSSFTGVKWLHLVGNHWHSTDITHPLQHEYWRHKAVLPALHKVYLEHPGPRHVPLSEAVVSFMTTRWRSGYPIVGVEYERLCHISDPRGTGALSEDSEPVTNYEMLCDDILLNIFRQYLDASPRLWPILTHICRRWRQVIRRSPLGLQLRLYCTYGTPVSKDLDCWPPLPLVINYGGSPMLNPPAPEDDDNIIAAFKQSDRVNSISLTLTNSLLGKLSTISEPFSELEELVLLSQAKLQLTLPSTFRWGTRLRVTRIVIPALPQLLSSSTDLVDLQLNEIPMAGSFSPQAFANALSGASHLRSLSLHFLSFPPRRNYVGLPPPGGHGIVLPTLTRFTYRGISKYLDSLVARIDAPHLKDVDITFFSQPTKDASQLVRFIERIDMQTPLGPPTKAEIQTSPHAISFKTSSTYTNLRLQISCKQLDWQLSSMAQVCDQFSPFLFGVQDLVFNTDDLSSGQDNVDGEQWLQLVRSFGGAETLSIAGELATGLLRALRAAGGGYTTDTAVLPALRSLDIREPRPLRPFWEAAQSLISSRGLSCHPVEQVLCDICNTSSTPQEIKKHFRERHAYLFFCSYCNDFQCRLGYIYRFREHLISKHPEVAQKDELISQKSLLTLLDPDPDTLLYRYSTLREPQIVAPSDTVTAPYS